MKNKIFNELEKTNMKLGKAIHNMNNHQRVLFGDNSYTYAVGIEKAINLYKNGEYEAVEEILAIINNGIDIINTEIIIAGSHKVDSMTTYPRSNIPLTKFILKHNYRVSDSFNDVSLNSINDNLPVRLSNKALSKVIRECFPDVKARKCTNDTKYNMEMII